MRNLFNRKVRVVRSNKQPWYVNASRVRLAQVNRKFAERTRKNMLVLDAGAGRGPYRRLFRHARYEAADFAQLSTAYTKLDYVCSLVDIPVEDAARSAEWLPLFSSRLTLSLTSSGRPWVSYS